MREFRYEVVGIGNAIVDVISRESDQFLVEQQLVKSSMQLIPADRADELYRHMAPAIETSGGSAANTMAGVASFGGGSAFIGKVRDDQLGEVFRHDIRAVGVDYDVPAATDGPPTARCLIVVTPDAARTMNTYLGISGQLEPADIDTDLVTSSRILYCEGYIWDVPVTKQAIRKALDAARAAETMVSFTLSDTFCVERHLDEWHELLDSHIDLLFGNEHEMATLLDTDDLDEIVVALRGKCDVACITRSEKGSLIVSADGEIEVPAVPVDEVVDTTGAGDLYAAGVLHGLASGQDLATCGHLGSLAAAEVISHMGARPAVSLSSLEAQAVG